MLKRLPSIHEIISVYAVISFITYGWTLVAFSGKIPAWSRFLTSGEILVIYSYSLLTNFSESMIVLALLLFLCLFLPSRLMLDVFVVRGSIIVICLLSAIIFNLVFYTNADTTFIVGLPGWLVIAVSALIIMVLLDLLSRNVPFVKSIFVGLTNWLMVFSYIFLALSFLALFVIAGKNLL
jgi:hypothetical protein